MRAELVLAATVLLAACKAKPDTSDELRRRDEFARAVAEDAGARGVALANAPDLRYESGFSDVLYDEDATERCWPARSDMQCARRWMFQGYRKAPFRWLGAHAFLRLRTHGTRPMRFSVHGYVDQTALHTTPYLSAYVDGTTLATVDIAPEDGSFSLQAVVDPSQLAGHEWIGVTIDLSTVAWHWLDVRDLRVAIVDHVEWAEADAPKAASSP
jgi:hypothetical protein